MSTGISTPLAYTVRYIELKRAKARQVLPYVLAIINEIGFGSVDSIQSTTGGATKEGLLLTICTSVTNFLETTISTSLDIDHLTEYSPRVFYPPLLYVTKAVPTLVPKVTALKLLPPDMECEWIEVDTERNALAISGPSLRADNYKQTVLPSLLALVHSFEQPGFPLG